MRIAVSSSTFRSRRCQQEPAACGAVSGGLGAAQWIVTAAAICGLATLFGLSWRAGIVIGLALALSATAIALQILEERGQLQQSHAQRAIDALMADGFPREWLTILAKDTEPAATFIETALGAPPARIELKNLGTVVAHGPLLDLLRGTDDGLSRSGLAGSFNRAGFQPHDGHIYETLTGRGGVLAPVPGGREPEQAAD